MIKALQFKFLLLKKTFKKFKENYINLIKLINIHIIFISSLHFELKRKWKR